MLLQPEALPEHFAHGVANRIFGFAAGDRLDLLAGSTQPVLQRVGGVQHATQGTRMAAAHAQGQHAQQHDQGGYDQQQGKGGHVQSRAGSLPAVCRAWAAAANRGLPGRRRPLFGKGKWRASNLTAGAANFNIPPLMSVDVPADGVPGLLDGWRMVAARRVFQGCLPLASMQRLRDSLADDAGEVRFALEFDRDALQVPYVELRIETALPLECQRSLERYLHPVRLVQRLGMIRDEADEAALPEGYEPLLVPEDGMLRPAELVEDELVLAVPVVALKPGSEAVQRDWPASEEEQRQASPFAALAGLKRQ